MRGSSHRPGRSRFVIMPAVFRMAFIFSMHRYFWSWPARSKWSHILISSPFLSAIGYSLPQRFASPQLSSSMGAMSHFGNICPPNVETRRLEKSVSARQLNTSIMLRVNAPKAPHIRARVSIALSAQHGVCRRWRRPLARQTIGPNQAQDDRRENELVKEFLLDECQEKEKEEHRMNGGVQFLRFLQASTDGRGHNLEQNKQHRQHPDDAEPHRHIDAFILEIESALGIDAKHGPELF